MKKITLAIAAVLSLGVSSASAQTTGAESYGTLSTNNGFLTITQNLAALSPQTLAGLAAAATGTVMVAFDSAGNARIIDEDDEDPVTTTEDPGTVTDTTTVTVTVPTVTTTVTVTN